MARYVLPIAGAVVGGMFGGPMGAQLGWAIGSALGNAVDPQVIKGPSIGDIAQQTSQEGIPRPIVFGVSQPIAGNIIATSEPQIVRRRERQGKGGPKVETESVYRTYAIRICEGPIGGVLRVWRDNQLVYDIRPGSDVSSADNEKFLQTARFFTGSYDQNPSPDLEAVFGVGTTPAHRGTAYMVMANEDLTDRRGSIPTFQFQVASEVVDSSFVQNINLDSTQDGGEDPTEGLAEGVTISGFDPTDTIIVHRDTTSPTWIAFSVWGQPNISGPSTGSTWRVHVIKDGDINNVDSYGVSGGPYDGYQAAADAFDAQFPDGMEITGAESYTFYIQDTPLFDNSGGLSMEIRYIEAYAETLPLRTIVSLICERAGLTTDQYDVSQLDDIEVYGLTLVNTYPAYAALQSLSQVFFFSPSYYDGVVHFVHGGLDTVATITEDDMVDDHDVEIEEALRDDPITVPRVMHLMYYDVAGGLATDKQSSERAGDYRAKGEQSLQSSVVMDANQAARAVAINHKVSIENLRGTLKFCLPDSWIRLVPNDHVFVQYNGQTKRTRITKAEILDGYQQYELLHDRQSAYTSEVEGIPAAPQTPPPSNIIGPTLIEPLDIHILRDADDNAGLLYYVAVSGTSAAWTGALIELSLDGGANYVDSLSTSTDTIMGALESELQDHPQSYPDVENMVAVEIQTPFADFQETDLAGLLNRFNLALIGNEIVQFAEANETSEGHWELSTLLRGRKGTQTNYWPAGTRFVLLDTATVGTIPASILDIGRTLTFRATSFGETEDTATVTSMVYVGQAQVEREPAYLQAHMSGVNAVITWQGVGRLGAGAQVAHGVRFAGYRVTLTGDNAVVITVDTDDQFLTQDVSTLTEPIHITVVQLNELTGEGPAIELFLGA